MSATIVFSSGVELEVAGDQPTVHSELIAGGGAGSLVEFKRPKGGVVSVAPAHVAFVVNSPAGGEAVALS